MTTVSLPRLQQLLTRHHLHPSRTLRRLIAVLGARDKATTLADQIEAEINSSVGFPRVVLEVSGVLIFVASKSQLRDLVASGRLEDRDFLRAERRLTDRQRQWWDTANTTGLRGLRRRERQFALRAQRLARSALSAPTFKISELRFKLIVMAASAAETSTTQPVLTGLVGDLARILRQRC
jgi:hypothetical protein